MENINGFGQIASNYEEDDVYNDIVRGANLALALLKETEDLEDIKDIKQKLQLQIIEGERLMQELAEKNKQLGELEEYLECKKADYKQQKSQSSLIDQTVSSIFNDMKIFNTKASHKIREELILHGISIEYEYHDDQVIIKIQKNDQWFELGLNENLGFDLLDMNPKHSRFDEIKVLFDSTKNFYGLFSIYKWIEMKQ